MSIGPRGLAEICRADSHALLLGTTLVSAAILGMVAAPAPAHAVRACVQPGSPTPVDDFSNADAITCVNTEARTADGVPAGEDEAIAIGTNGNDLFITLDNSGQLTAVTGPAQASGIDVNTLGDRSTINVTNSVAIQASSAAGARGINASTNGLDARIDIFNTGDITASSGGDDSYIQGIAATANGINSPIKIINQGNIRLQGNGTDDRSRAIDAYTLNNNSSIHIENSGDIVVVTGTFLDSYYSVDSNVRPFGIEAGIQGSNSDIYIKNSGKISVTSSTFFGSRGIRADTYDGAVNSDIVVVNSGEIEATSTAGSGPFAIQLNSYGGDVRVYNTANLTGTSKQGGNVGGIDADTNADNASAVVRNSGDIRVTSEQGGSTRGIDSFTEAGASIDIINSGDIWSTASASPAFGEGSSARGIEGDSFGTNADIRIENSGNLEVTAGDAINNAYSGGSARGIDASGRPGCSAVCYDYSIDIEIINSGNIQVKGGDGAPAYFGYAGFGSARGIEGHTDADNSPITITNSGDVTATGGTNGYARGLNALTDGPNSTITIQNSGAVAASATNQPGVGIFASATGANSPVLITNSSAGGVTGNTYAIQSESSLSNTVNNSGTVTGNVLFNGGGSNAFNNQGGGLFNAGATVNLGAGNLFTNDGDLSPGGTGTIQVTTLTGNIVQNGGGLFTVDADRGATDSDLVNVSGTANLSGNVLAQVINPAFGPQSNVILSAAGGTTNNGLGLLASPALQATLSFPNANDVVLGVDIDFTLPGVALNQNQNAVASNLNAIVGSGGGTVGPVLSALLNGVLSVPDHIDGLDQLIPEGYRNTETVGLFTAEEFNETLLSCPQTGDGYTAVSQGQCMWVRYGGRWTDRDGTSQTIGYEEDSHGISGGGQVAVAPNWFVGIAAAYENGDLDTDTNASADTDRYMLGGVIKYQSGPMVLALAGSFSTGEVDMVRRLNIGGFTPTARSSYDVDHVGATFHAAYLLDRSSWYAKPFVDVNVTHIDRDSATETGGGAANLSISGSDETYFSVTPVLELGTTIDRGDGRTMRPYVRAGVTIYGDTDQSVTARFVGAPAAVGGFTTNSEFDDVFADIAAGVTLFDGDQHTVSAGYEGRFSDDTEIHGFFVKGTRTF